MGAMNADFVKMNGLGNEIIVADMRGRGDSTSAEAAIALAADQRTAFDQIMAVHDPRTEGSDAWIDILNSDGSHAGACGNGTRCVVAWLQRQNGKRNFIFETIAGRLDTQYQDDNNISVNMGVPRFDWQQIPLAEEFADTRGIELQIGPIDDPVLHTPSVANIGNPHAVFWADGDVWNYNLERFGPLLENHPIFLDRANITIANVISPSALKIRTWERGAGITRACGSGACAAAVSAARTERTGRKVTVTVPGGDLVIDWRADNFIIMSGPAEFEFSGRFDPQTGAFETDLEAETL